MGGGGGGGGWSQRRLNEQDTHMMAGVPSAY